MSQIKEIHYHTTKALLQSNRSNSLVTIRPCDEQYKDKTFLGFLLGEIALNTMLSITDDKISCGFANYNPAIYVPELNKVIYGCESWWGMVNSEEDFKKISDQDIENIWYVKLYREMVKDKS